MADTRIGRTVSVAGSRRKATFSAWVKKSRLDEAWLLSAGGTYSGGDVFKIGFDDIDSCFIVGPSSTPRLQSTNKFRDMSGYYHYVLGIDTEQSTASDRLKFYINGVQVTAFFTETYPTLNQDLPMNNTGSDNNMWLGGRGGGGYEFSGIMSHVHWIDGTQYAASDFGSTDATTGEWKIKTSPSVTYGENGFFVLKDGSSLTDQSGEGNNLTLLTGTLTNTEDCPSDVFATLNPLYGNGNYTFEHGNNSLEGNNGNDWGISVPATLGASKGKYYWEVKQVAGSHTDYNLFGFIDYEKNYTGSSHLNAVEMCAIQTASATTSTIYTSDTTGSGYLKIAGSQISISDNDIVSFTLDMDNRKGWVAKNGTWCDDLSAGVGNPSTGANALWTTAYITEGSTYTPLSIQYYDPKCQYNFGNGYFGTTAISSEGTNASNIGKFEYDVPTGFTALSTKGLNE